MSDKKDTTYEDIYRKLDKYDNNIKDDDSTDQLANILDGYETGYKPLEDSQREIDEIKILDNQDFEIEIDEDEILRVYNENLHNTSTVKNLEQIEEEERLKKEKMERIQAKIAQLQSKLETEQKTEEPENAEFDIFGEVEITPSVEDKEDSIIEDIQLEKERAIDEVILKMKLDSNLQTTATLDDLNDLEDAIAASEPSPLEDIKLVDEQPVVKPAPVVEETVVEQPVVKPTPVIEETVVEQPVVKPVPVVEETVVEQPVVKPAPVVEETVVEQPVVADPVVEEPTTKKSRNKKETKKATEQGEKKKVNVIDVLIIITIIILIALLVYISYENQYFERLIDKIQGLF